MPAGRLGGPRGVGKTGEDEVRLARHDGETEICQTPGEPGAAVPVRRVDRIVMAGVGQRGVRGRHRGAGERKRRGDAADVGDDVRRRVEPADARAGQPENLRKGPAHDDVRCAVDQRMDRLPPRIVDIFVVGAIQHEEGLGRYRGMQFLQFIAAKVGTRGVLRIGEVDHPRVLVDPVDQMADRGAEALIGNRADIGVVGEGVVGRLGVTVLAAQHLGPGAKIYPRQTRQKIVRAVADRNLRRVDAEEGRDLGRQQSVDILGVPFKTPRRFARRFDRQRARPEHAFVGIQQQVRRRQPLILGFGHIGFDLANARPGGLNGHVAILGV